MHGGMISEQRGGIIGIRNPETAAIEEWPPATPRPRSQLVKLQFSRIIRP
jgi:hypothetical protein